jgi:hypothetical protein
VVASRRETESGCYPGNTRVTGTTAQPRVYCHCKLAATGVHVLSIIDCCHFGYIAQLEALFFN